MPRKIEPSDSHLRTVLYSCQHSQIFTKPWPRIGEHVVCVRCADAVTVLSVDSEYRIKCRNCRFGRRFGVAGELTAKRSAGNHARTRAHTVDTFKGERLIITVQPQVETIF